MSMKIPGDGSKFTASLELLIMLFAVLPALEFAWNEGEGRPLPDDGNCCDCVTRGPFWLRQNFAI